VCGDEFGVLGHKVVDGCIVCCCAFPGNLGVNEGVGVADGIVERRGAGGLDVLCAGEEVRLPGCLVDWEMMMGDAGGTSDPFGVVILGDVLEDGAHGLREAVQVVLVDGGEVVETVEVLCILEARLHVPEEGRGDEDPASFVCREVGGEEGAYCVNGSWVVDVHDNGRVGCGLGEGRRFGGGAKGDMYRTLGRERGLYRGV